MRRLIILSAALLTSGCWTPGPGDTDPTRYPWDPRNAPHPPLVARGAISPVATPQPATPPVKETYCVVALIPPNASGITFGGKAQANLGCPTECAVSSNAWVTDGKQPQGVVTCETPRAAAPTAPRLPASAPAGIVVTGPGPDYARHFPASERIDPRSRECADQAKRLAALVARHHLEIRDHRAFIDRASWESGAKADWPAIAWGIAYSASCTAGTRGTHTIAMFDRDPTIRDPMKRMLAFQNVSTGLECHGDHAVVASGDTLYLC